MFSISFTRANTKFCLNLHYKVDNSYFFINGNKIFKFKADNKIVKLSNSVLPRKYIEFCNTEFEEVSLNGNIYDFSLDYNSIDKSDILHIHKYLMTKNNMK